MCHKIGLKNLWTYGSIILAPIIYGLRCSLSCLSRDEKIKKKKTPLVFQLNHRRLGVKNLANLLVLLNSL